MRTVVDIPDEDVAVLNQVSKAEGISRAEFVRRAIKASVEHHHRRDDLTQFFGIWKGAPEDGLAFQRRMRSEW